jgi:hypothetical protein
MFFLVWGSDQASVDAGLDDARTAGKIVTLAVPGRPGIRVIAKQFGVSPMTVQNVAN